MSNPFTNPHRTPAPRPAASASGTGNPAWSALASTTPEKATIEPTERSIPAEMMTNVIPTATTALIETCCEYGVIPFSLDAPNAISDDSVILLKQILQDGYDVYVLKEPTAKYEKDSLRVLTNEHGFIIKDHSKSFCKILIGEEGKFQKSDDICLKN